MSGEDEIKEEVKNELEGMRQRIAELEILAEKQKHAEKCWVEAMAILIGKVGARKDRE